MLLTTVTNVATDLIPLMTRGSKSLNVK